MLFIATNIIKKSSTFISNY